jgi:prepilin-type N-terminal cleavage/methylation domain-containing protein
MNSGQPNNQQQRAFTLIELLVAVAIITLLIGMLLPSLARSREAARCVVCKGHFSEWSKAMLMYTQQFNGSLPYENRPDPANPLENGRVCWFDAADRYFKTTEADPAVKVCPTVRRDDPNRLEGYRMNSKLAEVRPESPYHRPFRKVDSLKVPHATVLLFDGDVGGQVISFKGRWRIRNDDVNYRHNVSTNMLFAAGNIETVQRRPLLKRSENNTSIVWQPADMGPWDPDPDPSKDD